MIKFLAIVAITASSSIIGVMLSMKLGTRVKELATLKKFILDVREEIRYSGRKIEKITEELLSSPEYDLLKNGDFIDESDRKAYREFLKGLGKSDISGQMTYCEFAMKKIDEKLSVASKKYSETGKVYCTLGFCAGLALSLIII